MDIVLAESYGIRRAGTRAFYEYRRVAKNSDPKIVFGRRLREARIRKGVAQDQLGVLIGIDELCSSARISRYETGTHAPSFSIAERLAEVLGVPVAYFYCPDDRLAELILSYAGLKKKDKEAVANFVRGLVT